MTSLYVMQIAASCGDQPHVPAPAGRRPDTVSAGCCATCLNLLLRLSRYRQADAVDKPVHNELLGGEQLPTRLMQPIRSPHDAMENIAILRTRFLWTAAGSPRRFRCARKFFLLDGGYAVSIAPMNIILGSAIDAWTEAVADAESAEKLLDQSWHLHLDGLGPAVTEGFVKEVAQFRSRAQARLAIVLALMNPATDESPLAVETERGQHRFLCA